jgi:hypothetical protein
MALRPRLPKSSPLKGTFNLPGSEPALAGLNYSAVGFNPRIDPGLVTERTFVGFLHHYSNIHNLLIEFNNY